MAADHTAVISSPYLTLTEAETYTRKSAKTILNSRALTGLPEAMPGSRRPLLFTRAALDEWLAAPRRRSRRPRKRKPRATSPPSPTPTTTD